MRASRIQVVTLLVVALIFGAVQCVASCVSESASNSVPPCHRHQAPSKAVSADCTHDFLLPDAQASSLAHIATIALAAPALPCTQAFIITKIFIAPALSPPDPSLSSSTILRI
jgi:hypothetical protein